jgi:multiple sugar transport system ATP-binding protein
LLLIGDAMKIEIKKLAKKYDEVIAVSNLDIRVNSGELVSILGPSGCGKSTLLYMLAGIVEPTCGEIFFEETKVNDVPIEKRNIGLVFQNYSLYPHMTVLENLMFPLRMADVKKKAAMEEAERISKILRIEELLKRKPKELSGGQQQRVAIGRALIKRPRFLLMDEPFSNLDAALRVEMREEVKELQKSFNITTLFVTHDQEEAMAISDRILLMNKGQLVQYSTGEKLYASPNSVFSASFIGNPKINLIESHEDLIIDKKQDTKGLKVGIRPEDIILSKDEDTIDKRYLQGSIIDIQNLGKEIHYKLDVNGIILRGLSMGDRNFNTGDRVNISFRKVHFLKE